MLIAQTIPEAWRRIVEEPDELLIELFADKVESLCGYRPELEKLSNFIQEKYAAQNNKTSDPKALPTPETLKRINRGSTTSAVSTNKDVKTKRGRRCNGRQNYHRFSGKRSLFQSPEDPT